MACTDPVVEEDPDLGPDVCEVDDDDCDGYTEAEGDCDDTDATINPGAEETSESSDNNCNGVLGEGITTFLLYTDIVGCASTDYENLLPREEQLNGTLSVFFEDAQYVLTSGWTDSVITEGFDSKLYGIDIYFNQFCPNELGCHNAIQLQQLTGPNDTFAYDWYVGEKPAYLTQDFWASWDETTGEDTAYITHFNPNFSTCDDGEEEELDVEDENYTNVDVVFVIYPDEDERAEINDLIADYDDYYYKLINGWFYDSYNQVFLKKADVTEDLDVIFGSFEII